MICSCCSKQKAELHARKSRLLAGMTLYLCNDCIHAKREPRYVIILAGRAKGPGFVADYITHRRYIGADILAKELLA